VTIEPNCALRSCRTGDLSRWGVLSTAVVVFDRTAADAAAGRVEQSDLAACSWQVLPGDHKVQGTLLRDGLAASACIRMLYPLQRSSSSSRCSNSFSAARPGSIVGLTAAGSTEMVV